MTSDGVGGGITLDKINALKESVCVCVCVCGWMHEMYAYFDSDRFLYPTAVICYTSVNVCLFHVLQLMAM